MTGEFSPPPRNRYFPVTKMSSKQEKQNPNSSAPLTNSPLVLLPCIQGLRSMATTAVPMMKSQVLILFPVFPSHFVKLRIVIFRKKSSFRKIPGL